MGLEGMIREHRRWLPIIGRVLLVLTFLEDGVRVATNWSEQVSFLTFEGNNWCMPHFLASIFMAYTLFAQFAGGLLVVLNKAVTFASMLLLVFMAFVMAIYGFGLPEYVHHQGRWRFIFRSMAIVGGLLMLIADEQCRKARESHYFAGVPVLEPLKFAHSLQAAGRVMIALLCVQYYWHGWVYGIICTVASVSIIVGFGTRYSSFFLAMFMTVSNFVGNFFWDVFPSDWDAFFYFFFQDLSILGGNAGRISSFTSAHKRQCTTQQMKVYFDRTLHG